MEALVPLGFHITPDIKIKFVQDPAGLVRGIMDSSEGPKEVKVVLSDGEVPSIQKIRRVLQNQFLVPTYYPVVNEVKFESTLAADRGWATYKERFFQGEKTLCRSNGMVSYIQGDKVLTWDWMTDSSCEHPYEGRCITAIAENSEGDLIAGDKEGKFSVLGKEYDTQIRREIDVIIALSSSIYIVKYTKREWSENPLLIIFDLENQSVLKTENSFTLLSEDGVIVCTDYTGTVTVKKFDVNIKVYREQSRHFQCRYKTCVQSNTIFSLYRSNKHRRGIVEVWDLKTNQDYSVIDRELWDSLDLEGTVIVQEHDPARKPRFKQLVINGRRVTKIAQLSSGFSICATDRWGDKSSIHVIDREGKAFSSQFEDLTKNRKIKKIEQLTKGCVFILYENAMAILKPQDVRGDAEVAEVLAKRPRLMPVVDPENLDSYEELVKLHDEQQYRALLSGLQSAMKIHFNIDRARFFYEKARCLRPWDDEVCHVFLSHLRNTFDRKLEEQVSMDLGKRN